MATSKIGVGNFHSITSYFDDMAMVDIISEIKKYRKTNETDMVIFSFNNCTGMPTITSGVGIAILSTITNVTPVIAFYGNQIESANI